MTADADTDSNMDALLTEVGPFGRYQLITQLLICIPSILAGSYSVNYMISASSLDYRCKVPECDIGANNREIPYNQPWLASAIPYSNGKFDQCHRYAPVNQNKLTDTFQCDSNLFNTSQIIPCSEYIYASDEKNVQTEFNIHCMDSYQLALVGTVSNGARLISLPLVGLLCDRYGRLRVIMIILSCTALFGLIKSYSTSYLMYIILEFLDNLGTNTFAGVFVLVMESVHSNYRVISSMIVGCSFPLGELMLACVAMFVHDFRHLIRLLYAPSLLSIVYIWFVPESLRWLLVTGRVDRAIDVLQRTAAGNRKHLCEQSIEMIKKKYSIAANTNESDNASMFQSLRYVFKSRTLCLRFLNCCYLWVTCCFCYYGLSLSANSIPGENRYISFIFIFAIEIPGVLIAIPLLKYMRRVRLMSLMLFITAISTLITAWIPQDKGVLVLISFMIGKAAITCAINSVYVFTAEQWPTNIRTTVLNSCSMIGRIGAMISPLTAILSLQYERLPEILLGVAAVVGAILVRFCPETYSKRMPDTIEEANNL